MGPENKLNHGWTELLFPIAANLNLLRNRTCCLVRVFSQLVYIFEWMRWAFIWHVLSMPLWIVNDPPSVISVVNGYCPNAILHLHQAADTDTYRPMSTVTVRELPHAFIMTQWWVMRIVEEMCRTATYTTYVSATIATYQMMFNYII